MGAFKAYDENGKVLQETWQKCEQPKAYKCVTTPGFPNLYFSLGPNSGLGHNTVV